MGCPLDDPGTTRSQHMEPCWWCGGIGGLWYFMCLFLVLPGPREALRGCFGVMMQARVKVLGRPLKYGVGSEWECS